MIALTLTLCFAANSLGLERDEAASFLLARGWTREDDVLVAPNVTVDPAVQAAIALKQKITAEEVARLAEQVLFVEQ